MKPYWLPLLCLCASLSACKDQGVTQYEVPKEHSKAVIPSQGLPTQSNMPPSSTPGLEAQTAQFGIPIYQAPNHWETQELGKMRKGSWKVMNQLGEAEVTVLAFPGDVGGDLANINRWAGQINLEPITQSEYEAIREPAQVGHLEGHYILLQDTQHPQAIAAAIVPKGSGTWFFKMMGDKDVVLTEEPGFKHLLETVVFKD